MWLWRWTIVMSTCLAVGCAVIGLVEWYVLAYGVVDLECAVDPAMASGCLPAWEPTPKPWLAAALVFGSVAVVGLARIELQGLWGRLGHAPAVG
jgi:hypothetical protein